MRHGTDAELDQKAVVPEDLVLEEDLLDHLLRAADERGAVQGPRSVEVRPLHRAPAAFAADPVHHLLHARERDVGGLLRRLRDEAVRVDAERRRRNMTRGDRRAAMELCERRELLRPAADDRERHRQPERARARRRLRRAADRDPDRDPLLQRPRIHAALVRTVAQLEQLLELLGEQPVVVGEVVAEQRERLDERAAAGHDLGAAAREQIDRRELLEHAHRIVGAQHAHRTRQADRLRPLRRGSEHDGGRGDGEVGAVMLADAEDVEPYLVGELDLFEQIAESLRCSDGLVRQLREGIDTKFDCSTVTARSSASMQRESNVTSDSSRSSDSASSCGHAGR